MYKLTKLWHKKSAILLVLKLYIESQGFFLPQLKRQFIPGKWTLLKQMNVDCLTYFDFGIVENASVW